MKKMLMFSLLIPLFAACEKDDEIYVEPIDYTIKEFNITNGPSSDNSEYHIIIDVITESPFEEMIVVLSHASGQFPGGNNREYALHKKPSGFGRHFIYGPEHGLQNGTLSVTLKVREKNAEHFNVAKTLDMSISWDYDIPTNEAPEKVHILQQLEQTNAPGQEFSGFVSFTQNSLSEGYLQYQVYSHGSPIGTTQYVTLIGENGSFQIGNLGILDEGGLYQLVIKNIDPDYPSYRFVNEHGETIMNNGFPVSSLIIEFIVSSNEHISATMISHSFVDIIAHEFGVIGVIQKNFTEQRVISARLFQNNNYVAERTFVTAPHGGPEEEFSLVFNGLEENTSYTLKYFLDAQTEAFFEAETSTAGVGQFVATIGTIDHITPNGGRAQIIFTNNTQNIISGNLRFSSSNGNTIETYPISFNIGTNQIIYQQSDGHTQHGVVYIELIVNGQTIADASFTTEYIEYTNVRNLNSTGSQQGDTILFGNQSSTLSVFTLDTNGHDEVINFTFIFQMIDEHHPWEYFNTLGLSTYENIPVSQQNHWTNLGNDSYSVTMVISKALVLGGNAFSIYATTKAYTEGTEFSYKTVITDSVGQIIGNDADPLTVHMQ